MLSTGKDMRVEILLEFLEKVLLTEQRGSSRDVRGECWTRGFQPQERRCILQGFGARNVCSLGGR